MTCCLGIKGVEKTYLDRVQEPAEPLEMGRWERICDRDLDERGQMILVKPPCVFTVTSQKGEERMEEKHEGKTYVKKKLYTYVIFIFIYNFIFIYVCICLYLYIFIIYIIL